MHALINKDQNITQFFKIYSIQPYYNRITFCKTSNTKHTTMDDRVITLISMNEHTIYY